MATAADRVIDSGDRLPAAVGERRPGVIGVAGELLPDVRRIAVLRANALGDFVFALPALAALRAAYPDAELVLLAAPWHAALLAARPSPVDRVLVIPPAPGIRAPDPGEPAPAPDAMRNFVDRTRAEGFDLAIQLHGGGRNSNPIVTALGARLTAGLRAEDAPPLDRWLRYVYYQPEVFRYLEVAGLVGATPTGVLPSLAVTDADRAQAAEVLGVPERPRVALHPGATDTRRRWPAESFAEVARALAADGYEVLVTGTPAEAATVDRVVEAAAGAARPVVGVLDLGGLIGAYEGCELVISNDTGPLHVAGAVGTPTVGIYWIGNLLNGATPLRGAPGRSPPGPCTARSAASTARAASTPTGPATGSARTGTRSSATYRWRRCWRRRGSCCARRPERRAAPRTPPPPAR